MGDGAALVGFGPLTEGFVTQGWLRAKVCTPWCSRSSGRAVVGQAKSEQVTQSDMG